MLTPSCHEQHGNEDARVLAARIIQEFIRLVINPLEIVF